MRNIDIIEAFDVEDMACFIASITEKTKLWNDPAVNSVWLNKESEDGKLYRNGYVWNNHQWERPEGYDAYNKYKHSECWILRHIYDVLEAIMSTQTITSYNVLVVIPTIEVQAPFDDFMDVIKYKGVNFTIWSDFFDLHTEDCDDMEAARIERAYLERMTVINYTHPQLVNHVKVYFRNK